MNRIPLEGKVLNENARVAAELRERFREHRVLVVNLVSSPGSGKTTLLEKTLEAFPAGSRVAVLTGDLQTENDANRLKRYGYPVKQIVTGGTCHLDARMIEKHIADWDLDQLDLLVRALVQLSLGAAARFCCEVRGTARFPFDADWQPQLGNARSCSATFQRVGFAAN